MPTEASQPPEVCTACATIGEACADCKPSDNWKPGQPAEGKLTAGEVDGTIWFQEIDGRYYGQATLKFKHPLAIIGSAIHPIASMQPTGEHMERENFRDKFRRDVRVMAECLDVAVAAMNHKID